MKSFIAQPLITEKSLGQSANGVYQFVVPMWATKRQITDHIERHFNIEVIGVNTLRMSGDRVRFKNRPGTQASYKKAIVQIKSGQTIGEFSLPVEEKQTAAASDDSAAPAAVPATESKITVRSKSKKDK